MTIDDKLVNLSFDNSSCVCLTGQEDIKATVVYTIERMLARDFGLYYDTLDSEIIKYKPVTGNITIKLQNGVLTRDTRSVHAVGDIPKLHCIRYTIGGRIRSFTINDESDNGIIGVNMTEYNSQVSDGKWLRLANLVNGVCDFDFVQLDTQNGVLSFNFENDTWSEEELKIVYLLLSESILTPDGYRRVIMLTPLNELTKEHQKSLISALIKLTKNELVIFCDDVDIKCTRKVV